MRKLVVLISVLILAQGLSTTPMTPLAEAAALALLGVLPDHFQAAPPPALAEPARPIVRANEAKRPMPQTYAGGLIEKPNATRKPLPVQVVEQMAWMKEGQLIALERKSPQAIDIGSKMKFVATLVNHTDGRLHLVAEVIVRKGDGSKETLIPGYALQLGKGKSFRVPVGMAAKAKRFPPGLTQFIAYLRDRQGQLIDQASITFMVSLPLH